MYIDGMRIITENGETILVSGEKDMKGIVEVPDGVTQIKNEAFFNVQGITEVILPDGLKTIGRNAFGYCTNLKRIHIPDSVTDIGDEAFYSCRQLEEIVALNMLDPYPSSIYCSYDDVCRNGQEPSNRRLIYEDKEFIIPVSFPKVRLNSAYKPSWKTALTLGFLAHPDLYSAYDLDKKAKQYRGVNMAEKDIPYAKFAISNKKRLLSYIFLHDRPDMLWFYASCGGFSSKSIQESFLEPAKEEGATACVDFISKWLSKSIEIKPIVPRKDELLDLPGNISSEEALFNWAYEVDYSPDPTIRLTGFKSDGFDISVVIPERIDNIPVGIIGRRTFYGYIKYEGFHLAMYSDGIVGKSRIDSITCGNNIKKIECGMQCRNVKITIKAPNGSYAHQYALDNNCEYEEIE